MFGSGKNSYPGMMATETIGANETIIKVPAKMVLTSKTAFYSEINQIFYENPEIFGKHVEEGLDNVLNSFILYELSKGDKSFWYPMFEIWPRDTDLLFNWDQEDLEWL
jgi:hypothetical protein